MYKEYRTILGDTIHKLVCEAGFTDLEVSLFKELLWSIGYDNWVEGLGNLWYNYPLHALTSDDDGSIDNDNTTVYELLVETITNSIKEGSQYVDIDNFFIKITHLLYNLSSHLLGSCSGMSGLVITKEMIICEVLM